jgi:iron complex outermembrane recepter protein
MNKILYQIATFLLFCLPFHSLAQVKVSGTVLDGTDLLIGALVVIQGTQKGVIADETGYFEIDVPPNCQLTISYVGYHNQIVKIGQMDVVLTIQMTSGTQLPNYFISESGNYDYTTNRSTLWVTNSDLKAQGATSISAALAQYQGVSQLTTGAISKSVLRGLHGNRLKINVGGMPFNNQQWLDEQGLGLNDMGFERVEILKGSAALLYGSDAVGGLLNVVDERFMPQKVFVECGFGQSKDPQIIQTINLKTFSNSYGFGADYGYKKQGKGTLILRGGFENHADYSDGNNQRILNTRFANYNLKAGYIISNGDFSSENRAHFSFNQFGLALDSNDVKAVDNRLSRTFDGRHQATFSTIFTSKNTFRLQNNGEIIVTGGFHNNHLEERNVGNRSHLGLLLNTFSIKTDWVKIFQNDWYLTNGISGVLEKNINTGSRILVPDASNTEGSLFSYLKKSFYDRKLFFETGIRYDFKRIETFLTSELNPPTSQIAPLSRNFNALNGAFDVSYCSNIPIGSFNTKLDISTGFRAPNLAELSSKRFRENRQIVEFGNVDLKAEKSLNLELSANLTLRSGVFGGLYVGDLTIKGAVFRNIFANYIYLSPTDKKLIGLDIYTYRQSEAILQGFEAGLVYQPIVSYLTFSSDFSYLDARRQDGSWLPFTPANRLKNEVKWRLRSFFRSHFAESYIKLCATYAQAQNHPSEFETGTPQYWLLNLGFSTTYKHLQVLLNCNNLTNKVYNDHLSRYKYLDFRDRGRDIVLTFSYQFLK